MIKIASYVKKLLLEYPYYGAFLCGINKVVSDKIDTAGVRLNGINYQLTINPDFWEVLTDDEKKGLLMHETLHLCFMHVEQNSELRKLARTHELYNIACDLEVQSYVPKEWYIVDAESGEYVGTADALRQQLTLPTKMGTKWYIQYLVKMQDLIQQYCTGEGTSEGQDGDTDKSSQWPRSFNAEERAKQDFDNLTDEQKQRLKERFEEENKSHAGWDDINNLPESIKKLIKDQLAHQIEQAADAIKGCNPLPKEMGPILEILTTKRKPVFDWKRYFRRFLGTSFDVNQRKTRRKQSNRFEDSPGMVLRKKHNILVAVDVSGSISRKDYDEFFNELHYVYKAGAKIKVIEVNTDIVTEYDYKGVTPKPHAGGGTAFLPAIDYYNKHRSLYSTMVYFTDGESWDVKDCKPLGRMLWVISSGGDQKQNYPGVKICIPKD